MGIFIADSRLHEGGCPLCDDPLDLSELKRDTPAGEGRCINCDKPCGQCTCARYELAK